MIKVHFYKDSKEINKIINSDYNQYLYKIAQELNISEPSLLFYEYLTSDKEYHLLNENNYNIFLNSNVTDIYIYTSLEETKSKNKNEQMIEIRSVGEGEPEFYGDDNNVENNINNYNKALQEKIKQNVINLQKEKIRKSRLQKEEEEKQKIQNQNEIIIENNIILNNSNNNINYNNIENNIENNEIINIINNKFEEFKEDLINESKIQATQIVMESKLKIEGNNNNDIETPCSVEKHSGTVCNGCGLFNIQGVRYKCIQCGDFDFCEQCYEEKKYIHGHPFYKLRFIIE